jgi:hypothetical protein
MNVEHRDPYIYWINSQVQKDYFFIFLLSNCIIYFIKLSDEDGIVAGNESLENAGKSYFNIKRFRSLFIVIGNNVQIVFYIQVLNCNNSRCN